MRPKWGLRMSDLTHPALSTLHPAVREEDLERWFAGAWGGALARRLSAAELDEVRRTARARLAGREVSWRTATLFLAAEKTGS